MSETRRVAPHLMTCAALALAAVTALAGCVPEPSESPSASDAPTTAVSSGGPATPAPTSSPTMSAEDDITLPAACAQLYSPSMLAQLEAQAPPLNDPGVTMYSTQVVAALEVLNSGIPTLRCSWGMPSESGLATNVSIVDAAASATIVDALTGSGFACSAHASGTLCTAEQESMTQDDTLVRRGESHFLRGDGWVSTAWITVDPDGYTDDIAATLWG